MLCYFFQQAFFQGKLKIQGNMGLAMKLREFQNRTKSKLWGERNVINCSSLQKDVIYPERSCDLCIHQSSLTFWSCDSSTVDQLTDLRFHSWGSEGLIVINQACFCVSLNYLFYFCDFHNTPFPPNLRYLLIYMYWCYRGINVHLCFISVWMWLKRNTSIGSASAITDISYTGIFFS